MTTRSTAAAPAAARRSVSRLASSAAMFSAAAKIGECLIEVWCPHAVRSQLTDRELTPRLAQMGNDADLDDRLSMGGFDGCPSLAARLDRRRGGSKMQGVSPGGLLGGRRGLGPRPVQPGDVIDVAAVLLIPVPPHVPGDRGQLHLKRLTAPVDDDVQVRSAVGSQYLLHRRAQPLVREPRQQRPLVTQVFIRAFGAGSVIGERTAVHAVLVAIVRP